MKTTKTAVYAKYGIAYDTKKSRIYAPALGLWIKPLLKNGNSKLGKSVYTFSTLATCETWVIRKPNGEHISVKGTCPCHCDGCYACTGCYRFNSVKYVLALHTALIRIDLDFFKRAVKAQIEADNITICRIHASGDFDSMEYASAWKDIVKAFPRCLFWTYTKVMECEDLFNDCDNCNVVKSVIAGCGLNFGHCDYIIATYNKLRKAGKNVYICRCGIDANQHCTNCRGCAKNDYVLFIEHSTTYKATEDTLYETLKAIIEAQKSVAV